MKGPRVYSLYDPPPDPGLDASQGLGADQSFKDDCDINVIMARAVATGELIEPWDGYFRTGGQSVDVSELPDNYLDARNLVQKAQEDFAALPPRIRSRFQNDPYELLAFLSDDRNRREAEELGLVSADKQVVPAAKAADKAAEPPVAQ